MSQQVKAGQQLVLIASDPCHAAGKPASSGAASSAAGPAPRVLCEPRAAERQVVRPPALSVQTQKASAITLRLFFVFGLVSAFTWAASESTDGQVVFSIEELNEIVATQRCSVPAEPPYWLPSPEQISTVTGSLPLFLGSQSEAVGICRIWPNYHLQFAGVFLDGRPVIAINAFADSYTDALAYWRNTWVFVFDGGPSFFQLIFDPERLAFAQLWVNGYA